jgi:FKBP-type peptidyl-prolyl cis-trans isomerase SlyD
VNIQKDAAVTIHYHLTDPDGTVIGSSRGEEPLAYLHGHGGLVPGVERALDGQAVGAKLDLVVSPEDGYGVHDPALDIAVPIEAFPEENRGDIVGGAMFHGPHPADQDKVAMYTVVEVVGDEIRCTANHPLSGVTLHFSLEVIGIRDATAEELSHGHIHGPGGHHH